MDTSHLGVVFSVLLCATTLALAKEPVIFCYYSSHSQNRPGLGKFEPEDITTTLCTHVIFAFADVVDGKYLKANGWNDLGENGLYKRTVALKKKNPRLKILIAVGGWAAGSEPFIPVVATLESRRQFAENAVRFLRRHGFDGLDIDWEFPGTRGSSSDAKYKFTEFLKELQDAFKAEAPRTRNPKLLLTIAAAGGSYFINAAYETDKIAGHVDYLLVMTYNFHGSWNSFTGHHSGLFPREDETGGEREWNQAWSIDFWLNKAGVPRNKLVIGIPTYGMSFTLEDPTDNGLKAKANGGGSNGQYTGESGILSYYEICENLDRGWRGRWIDEQKVPYAVKGTDWVGYENEDSVKLKAKYINYLGLAGAFIWSVEMDDFRGICGNGRYPLLSTIAKTLRKGSRQNRQNQNQNVPLRTRDYDRDAAFEESKYILAQKNDYLPIKMENMNGGSVLRDSDTARTKLYRSKMERDFKSSLRPELRAASDSGMETRRRNKPVRKQLYRNAQYQDDIYDNEYIDDSSFPTPPSRYVQIENKPHLGYVSSQTVKNRDKDYLERADFNDYAKSGRFDSTSDEKKSLQLYDSGDDYALMRDMYYDDLYEDIVNARTKRFKSGATDSNDAAAKTNAKQMEDYPCTENGMFRDPQSCTDYFVCVQHGGQWYNFRMKCPNNLAFIAHSATCENRDDCY